MFEKDYLMKLLAYFFDSLNKILNNTPKEQIEDIKVQLNELCTNCLQHDFTLLTQQDAEGIKNQDAFSMEKIGIAAELLYQNAIVEEDTIIQHQFFQKVLELFLYVERYRKTFSLERNMKTEHIKSLLA